MERLIAEGCDIAPLPATVLTTYSCSWYIMG